jgi:NAD+ synthase (glutamine-hydrolysing)
LLRGVQHPGPGPRPRFQATAGKQLVIGVSGGLDSTHALIVAARACDDLGLPRSTILGFTMPGFATGEETKGNAWALMNALGIVGEEIDIRPAARQMLADIGHPFAKGEPVYDVTFENVQAGLRTDYLFRLANQRTAASWSAPATSARSRSAGRPTASATR